MALGRRRARRRLVRDYIFEHFDENPPDAGTNEADAIAVVSENIREDFGASPWLTILLKLVELLLPLILNLKKPQAEGDPPPSDSD